MIIYLAAITWVFLLWCHFIIIYTPSSCHFHTLLCGSCTRGVYMKGKNLRLWGLPCINITAMWWCGHEKTPNQALFMIFIKPMKSLYGSNYPKGIYLPTYLPTNILFDGLYICSCIWIQVEELLILSRPGICLYLEDIYMWSCNIFALGCKI
jgi:hypothetical protein